MALAWETVLIDGTDLATITGAYVEDVSGMLATSSSASDALTVPGRRSAYLAVGELQPYSYDIGIAIVGDTIAAQYDSWYTLTALLGDGGSELTISRRITRGSGQTTQTHRGVVVSATTPQTYGDKALRARLAIMNLDGCWYGSSASVSGTITSTGSVTPGGSVRSARGTVTLSGGTNQVLPNSTTGTSLTFTGSTSTTVTITLEDWYAVRGGSDVSGLLTATGARAPMLFVPGSNSLSLSGGGSGAVSVYGAHR